MKFIFCLGLKVSKSRKQIMKSRILPKNERNSLKILSWVCFDRFLEESKTSSFAFEIYWPLRSCQKRLGIEETYLLAQNFKTAKASQAFQYIIIGSPYFNIVFFLISERKKCFWHHRSLLLFFWAVNAFFVCFSMYSRLLNKRIPSFK